MLLQLPVTTQYNTYTPMATNTQDLDIMSEEMIIKALEALRARLTRAEHERAELNRLIASFREEQGLLLRLLSLRREGPASVGDDGPPTVEEGTPLGEEQRPLLQTTDKANPVVQAVIQELATAGRPLHISELMRLLRVGGVQVPGAGTQANLITHLRRDSRLVRPSRGMYGLAEWGLDNMPVPERRRRRKKRVRSKATPGRIET